MQINLTPLKDSANTNPRHNSVLIEESGHANGAIVITIKDYSTERSLHINAKELMRAIKAVEED